MVKGSKKIKIPINPPLELSEAALPDFAGTSIASSCLGDYNRGSSAAPLTHAWNNLDALAMPHTLSGGHYSMRGPITLCRKVYYRVPIFKTAIDTMVDLYNTPLNLYDGNAQSNKFFSAWLNKINIWDLNDQFSRELFRGGSCFLYRADISIKAQDVSKLYLNNAAKIDIPGKYILLDAANITTQYLGNGTPVYSRVMTPLELTQLSNSKDTIDKAVYKSIKDAIGEYGSQTINYIKLDPERLHTVFYQKQDYEPFAVPMGYCVLDDINLLMEMKKADLTVSKAVEYMMLLVTMGAEKDKGGTNPLAMAALKSAFSNEKLGRALVADYTTKAEFVIPDLSLVMFPGKYDEIKSNIANGLMNIFFGDQQFANVMAKMKVFVKKLENAQQLFIDKFLQPEIKRISQLLKFKSYPKVEFQPIQLEDPANFQRMATQLIQMGVLTAKDGLELIETGLYPSYDTLLANQEEFRADKDKGLFAPIQGGPFDQLAMQQDSQTFQVDNADVLNPAPVVAPPSAKKPPSGNKGGRPSGTKSPQTKKKISPVGASIVEDNEDRFSQSKLVDNTILAYRIEKLVEDKYKLDNNRQRVNKSERLLIESKAWAIVENSSPNQWESLAKGDMLPDLNSESNLAISDIQVEYDVDDRKLASLLFHSSI